MYERLLQEMSLEEISTMIAGFRKVAANPRQIDPSCLAMTYNSYDNAFYKIFNSENKYFKSLLYNYIISDYGEKKIKENEGNVPISCFIQKMMPFVRIDPYHTSKAVYKLVNSFHRTHIQPCSETNDRFTLTDIIYALTQVSQDTQWGKELKYLQDKYFEKKILAAHKKKDSIIEPGFFTSVIPYSCLTSELMCKLFHAKIKGEPIRNGKNEVVINYMAMHQFENKLYPPIQNGSIFASPRLDSKNVLFYTLDSDTKAIQFFNSLQKF
jgi:hypothetical protein